MNKVIYINKDSSFNINKDETLEIYHFVVNKDVNIKINLNGENAKVIYHLSIISKDKNVCNIEVNHVSSNTESKVICHGVNTDDKRLEFNIKGVIPNKASNCICNEENEIINLKDGESIIKPNLLIRNFNTCSSHSAYIGEFNKEKLFYLESRGISKENAIKLLMEGLLIGDALKEEAKVQEFIKAMKEV